MSVTLNGTYTSTYNLTNPGTQNPLTITSTGLIDVNSPTIYAAGILGNAGFAWTITNLGTVESVGVQGNGISLLSGGIVVNDPGGYVAGTENGIQISGGAGTIVNSGVIAQVGTGFGAVSLSAGGTVTNTGTIFTVGTTGTGVALGGAGSVVNTARITGGFNGVSLSLGGDVNNAGVITANGGTNSSGVLIDTLSPSTATATVTNTGTINAGSGAGVRFVYSTGGSVINGATNQTGALIAGGFAGVVLVGSTPSTLVNYGTVSATGTNANGVTIGIPGGLIVNQASGVISAYHNGIGFFPGTAANAGVLTIVNHGRIQSTQPGPALNTGFNGFGISTGATSTTVVDNFGTIAASQTAGGGAILLAGGTITNEVGALLEGAGGNAVSGARGAAPTTVTNFGTIHTASTSNSNMYMGSGGIVTNAAGALIESGQTTAINFNNTLGNSTSIGHVDNAGTVLRTGTTGAAIYFGQGGTITNQASGSIIGYSNGVSIKNAPGTIINSGTIAHVGSGTSGEAVYLNGGGIVMNSGLLSGSKVGSPSNNGTGGYPGVVNVFNNSVTVVNLGTIANANNSNGVNLLPGGLVINGAAGTTGATIYAVHGAIYMGGTSGVPTPGAIGTVVNYGTIRNGGTNTSAIVLVSGGTVVNQGVIASGRNGVSLGSNTAGTIENFGTIISTAPVSGTRGSAVYLGAGGVMTNAAGGLVTALRAAVSLAYFGTTSATATVSNSGTLVGNLGVAIGASDTGSNTITNFGTIIGTSGIAVQLGSGNDTLVIEAGSSLVGAVGNFHPGDTIDLPFLTFANGGSVTLQAGNVLQVAENSGNFSVALDPNQNLAGDFFHLSADGSGGTEITATAGQPSPRDFDGNGASDLLWRDTGGDVAIWQMNAGTVTSSSVVGFADPSAWSIRGTGDFDGNGKSDILWQDTSGDVAVWTMNGSSVAATSLIGIADPTAWSIVATGDFNGDRTDDILWRDTTGDVAIWQMNGGTVASSGVVGFADNTWTIRGTGDFDGNGTSDILWQDTAGDVAIWQMNGGTVASSGIVGFADPANWHIRGTGDFAGNGTSDILWQDNSGDVAIWTMNGGTVASSGLVGFADPSTWHIAGIGDYDGDGKSDILWQDSAGAVNLWDMNGTSVAGTAFAGFADPTTWHLVPPDNSGAIPSTTTTAAPSFSFADITGAPTGTTAGPGSASPPAPSGGDPLLVAAGTPTPAGDPSLLHH